MATSIQTLERSSLLLDLVDDEISSPLAACSKFYILAMEKLLVTVTA